VLRLTRHAAAYYYAPATSPALANVWLLYLEGQTWCWSLGSCAQRSTQRKALTSSQSWPNSRLLGGLFSPDADRNPLAGAQRVLLGYCSSDAWTGDAAAGPATGGLAFAGQRIIRAVLASLVAQAGLGGAHLRPVPQPDKVLLAGGGAAGAGAMLLLDLLGGWLAAAMGVASPLNSSVATVAGLLDASLWTALAPLPPPRRGAAAVSYAQQVQSGFGLHNASRLMSPACLANYSLVTQQWMCMLPAVALSFVQTPYLLSQPLFDKRQLLNNLGGSLGGPGLSAATQALGAAQESYALSLAASLRAAAQPAAQAPHAAWLPACFRGSGGLSGQLWGVRVGAAAAGGHSLAQAVRVFFLEGRSGWMLADDCAGFACGAGCRKGPPHARATPRPDQALVVGSSSEAGGRSGGARRQGGHGSSRARTARAMLLLLMVLALSAAAFTRLLGGSQRAAGEKEEGTPLLPPARAQLAAWAEAEARERQSGRSRAEIAASFAAGAPPVALRG